MKYIPKLSSDTKNKLLGGVAGALAVNMESAANGLVAGYPQILKDRLITQVPRNGELIATVAPVAITWAVAKKKHSPRVQNVKTGVMLYDLPKLLDLFAYRIAYTAGLPPPATVAQRFNQPMVNRFVPMTVQRTASSSGTGKYTIKNSTRPAMRSGIGKYSA